MAKVPTDGYNQSVLNVFRRHSKDCKKGYPKAHRGKEKGDCNCPIHVEGRLESAYIRQSANTRSMSKARAMAVEAEETGTWVAVEPQVEPVSTGKPVAEAVADYLKEIESRKGKNLAKPTVSKYRTLLNRLAVYSERRGYNTLDTLTFEVLTAFKDSWPFQAVDPIRNSVTRLRKFYKYALKMKWCSANVADDLEMPAEEKVEILPFTPDEESTIYATALSMKLDRQQPITNHELQTFCYMMRYSGMAIADAALLQKTEIKGDEVRYFRKKTRRQPRRVSVVVPLPEWLINRLKAMPLQGGRYYFCHGSDLLVSAVDVWHSRLAKLFQAASIKDGGAHRFRHTFATSLLEAGESLEDVSRWLGHSSVKTTERYYSHWMESRIQRSSDKLRSRYASVIDSDTIK